MKPYKLSRKIESKKKVDICAFPNLDYSERNKNNLLSLYPKHNPIAYYYYIDIHCSILYLSMATTETIDQHYGGCFSLGRVTTNNSEIAARVSGLDNFLKRCLRDELKKHLPAKILEKITFNEDCSAFFYAGRTSDLSKKQIREIEQAMNRVMRSFYGDRMSL